MKRILENLRNMFDLTIGAIILFATVSIIAHVLSPLSPTITTAVVLAGTVFAVNAGWKTGAMATGGILLFVLSWPAANIWGSVVGQSVWLIGVLLWCATLPISIPFAVHPPKCT